MPPRQRPGTPTPAPRTTRSPTPEPDTALLRRNPEWAPARRVTSFDFTDLFLPSDMRVDEEEEEGACSCDSSGDDDDPVVIPSLRLPEPSIPAPDDRLPPIVYRGLPCELPTPTDRPAVFVARTPAAMTPTLLAPADSVYVQLQLHFDMPDGLGVILRTPRPPPMHEYGPLVLDTTYIEHLRVTGVGIVVTNIGERDACIGPSDPLVELVFVRHASVTWQDASQGPHAFGVGR